MRKASSWFLTAVGVMLAVTGVCQQPPSSLGDPDKYVNDRAATVTSHAQDAWAAIYSVVPEGIHAARAQQNERPYAEPIEDSASVGDMSVFINRVPHPSVPVQSSNLVATGIITKAQSYLTPQHKNVFTEYEFTIDQVVASASNPPPLTGKPITAERRGGSVKFPSGRVRRLIIVGEELPTVGGKYLLFLRHNPAGDDFRIMTGYRVEGGKVQPLDAELQGRQYNNAALEILVNDIMSTVAEHGIGKEVD